MGLFSFRLNMSKIKRGLGFPPAMLCCYIFNVRTLHEVQMVVKVYVSNDENVGHNSDVVIWNPLCDPDRTKAIGITRNNVEYPSFMQISNQEGLPCAFVISTWTVESLIFRKFAHKFNCFSCF